MAKRTNTGLREKINYEQLADLLLDQALETFGLSETCKSLLQAGYTKRELYYLGFEKDTIDQAKMEIKKEEEERVLYLWQTTKR